MARQIKIIKTGDIYLLNGTEGWADPCPADLIAHDIFHHEITDDGSMACELMSFGAQAWIEHHTDDIRLGIGYEGLSAILEDIAIVSDSPKHASLIVDATEPFVAVENRFRDRFVAVARDSVTESGMSHAFSALSDEFVSEMCSDQNVERYADWMSVGFTRAQERFPDPEATRMLFNAFIGVLRKWAGKEGDILSLTLDEQAASVGSPNSEVVDLFRSYGCEIIPFKKKVAPR